MGKKRDKRDPKPERPPVRWGVLLRTMEENAIRVEVVDLHGPHREARWDSFAKMWVSQDHYSSGTIRIGVVHHMVTQDDERIPNPAFSEELAELRGIADDRCTDLNNAQEGAVTA